MAEAEAVKAVAALKDATIIKTKKADWRLVAAAQAMLRGQHSDEFDAAQAFGKTIKQRREDPRVLKLRSSSPRTAVRHVFVNRVWCEIMRDLALHYKTEVTNGCLT